MNERAERLAGGGAQWLRRRGLCRLPNVIKKVSVCWSQGLRRAHHCLLGMWPSLGGCVTDGFDQAESPTSKRNCLEISCPDLTPPASRSAKVPWPWEESPGPRLWRETTLHLQSKKSTSLKWIYMVGCKDCGGVCMQLLRLNVPQEAWLQYKFVCVNLWWR